MRGPPTEPAAAGGGVNSVLLADDHPVFRSGVRVALERDGLQVCAEASNAQQAVEAALRERPDVCLLDVRMPGNGIRAAEQITRELEETTVVMLTVSGDPEELLDALRAGAAGYLLKDTDPTRLPELLRATARGATPVSPRLVGVLVDEFRRRIGRPYGVIPGRAGVELTDREHQVLELLRKGATPTDVAERLVLSKGTVRRHISSALGKLGAPSCDDALRLIGGVQELEHT